MAEFLLNTKKSFANVTGCLPVLIVLIVLILALFRESLLIVLHLSWFALIWPEFSLFVLISLRGMRKKTSNSKNFSQMQTYLKYLLFTDLSDLESFLSLYQSNKPLSFTHNLYTMITNLLMRMVKPEKNGNDNKCWSASQILIRL